ncbi:QacE family quaternary ammonium compound efflux SMR transporter [Mycolicibacterium chitae]|uniref:Transporter small multidrug resistance (SMR) family protein n=1 Tax=Mycolicibacterium chitae TaxID=1792 RepID=A0A448I5Y8_MYCCI|nr:SMR family transporter [Mycolicibacterium chitae]MCV7105667.1 QacE family quaternary ammonium compound efflux SMR transporter [Mycolicibacterium chitae]BBZ04299.1 QacE family quaternary ammonium compound efflux SMR transporter [Mycolicibacterium chitae]VEG47939.1 transporter small multidrug resistance (SMR) family protein [Mycolicibacterium chitae]
MWWALAGAIAIEVLATLALRASDGLRKRWWAIPVVLGYVASFALLSVSLSMGMPVGVAYGVWSASGVALVALLARVLFAEVLTPMMVAGIGLIIAGVLTIELFGALG